jgi:cytochrome c oxidase subunit III
MRAPELAVQFEDLDKQAHAARLGMWAFIGSEVLLFSGFFALYAAYRTMYRAHFVEAIRHNTIWHGSINTVVLITSSLTVALGIHAMRTGNRRSAARLVFVTIVLGAVFLGIKVLEYGDHFHHGIYPGVYYRYAALPTSGAKLFYTLYYLMTGAHALHVLAGMAALTWCWSMLKRGRWTPQYHVGFELSGIYWHLVDVIWIFIWPLLYLTR